MASVLFGVIWESIKTIKMKSKMIATATYETLKKEFYKSRFIQCNHADDLSVDAVLKRISR